MNFSSQGDHLSMSYGCSVSERVPFLPPTFFYCGSQMGFAEDAIDFLFSHQTMLTKARLMMETTFELRRKWHELATV